MFFHFETATDIYVIPLSKYRVTLWHDTLCVYEDDSSLPQPCLAFDISDISEIFLSDKEEH